jgi:uroporphyrinogen-III decarboxylase
MPLSGYFFDAIDRQMPVDDENLNVEDNLEEFSKITNETLNYWKQEVASAKNTGKAVMASLGGTALGDIALVPAMNLRNPKGIRNIEEWYISTIMRSDYIREVFDRQSALAIDNLSKIYDAVGNDIDVVFICGTDFGSQNSTFCSPEQFDDLWFPFYKRINDWIHSNTEWKTFKHSCGAVEGFMKNFIEAGFDIINPVQLSAAGMNPKELKDKYGKNLTFWGGSVDTQRTLPYGTTGDVRKEVLNLCEIFSRDGGFVFNTVHNIQADVPVENIVAMIDALHEFNGK